GQGRYDEALAAYEAALALDPALAQARLNAATIHLARAEFARGWPDYEARKQSSPHYRPRAFPYPEWQGPASGARSVLVHGEQGLGDEIMFASCLPDLMACVSRCVIDCSPRLASLFARSFPGAEVHAIVDEADLSWLACTGAIDAQVAMGSLPRH